MKTRNYATAQEKVANFFQQIFAHTNPQTDCYKILHPINIEQELRSLKAIAAKISSAFKNVIVIGMGGSFLNPQAAASLRKSNFNPVLHFLSNTDPLTLSNILNSVNLSETACVIISKSGATLETIALTGALLTKYTDQNIANLLHHFTFIVGKGESPIRNLATKLNSLILDHADGIGGRFSGFSNVALLPALICGLNMEKFLIGANSTINDFWQNKEKSRPALAAAVAFALDLPMQINITYFSKLIPYLELNRQLIAESLGKNNKGFMPAFGLGSNDQHSMLQLYLDGPKDKLFTIYHVTQPNDNEQFLIHPIVENDCLQNKNLQEVNVTEYLATKTTLQQNKLPIREICLSILDEESLGALIMHTYIETIILGLLIEINPFDQPHVEQIKIEALRLLSLK